MSHWTFWDWLGYVSIWIAAIISATEMGLKMATEFRSRTQHLTGNPYWAFAPVACLAISGMAFLVAEAGLGAMTGLVISSALVLLWMALLFCGAYKSQSKLGRLGSLLSLIWTAGVAIFVVYTSVRLYIAENQFLGFAETKAIANMPFFILSVEWQFLVLSAVPIIIVGSVVKGTLWIARGR